MSRAVPSKKIIVVLPAYHAVRTLARTYEAIPKDWVDEVILVDDASSDDTAALAHSLGIKTFVHPHNRGYGGNQKTCYREAMAAGADIAVMVHPDFQYDPAFIPGLIRPIAEGKADAVFGSRMLIPGGARAGGMPWWKFLANIALTAIANAVLGLRLSEYHSGFRAYSRLTLERLAFELNSDKFVFDTEIIVQMRLAGLRIREIPITTQYFPEASSVGFWRSVGYGVSIFFVLAKYLGHRLGIFRPAAFIPLIPQAGRCPACGAHRARLLHPVRAPREGRDPAYRITESSGGHGNILGCAACGIAYVSRSEATWTAAAYAAQPLDEEYVREEAGRRLASRRILRRLAALIGPHQGRKLLDFGAGAGFFADEARKAGWIASGLEIGETWVRYAAKRFGAEAAAQGGLKEMAEIPDESFDVITAWDVIEHLEDPAAFVRLSSRKLKPGGVFALSTPRLDSFAHRLFGGRWHAILPAHLTYFTRQSIRSVLAEAGLRVVSERSHSRFFSLAYLLRRLGIQRSPNLLRRVIVPVNFFDELEVYARQEAAKEAPGHGGR